MNICVFDTETTSINKPFCYNIGYVIYDTEHCCNVVEKDFVVEQVWHNPMLFSTAYYADKRPIYVKRMRAHTTIMDKFGYICQEMIRDFKTYDVKFAYAFNSPFDDNVFAFNCDWFKCNNPFDDITILDIRGFVHQFLVDDNYKLFCEKNEYFTDSKNYSTTAETVYRYLFDNDFTEEHTALADSKIECEILNHCVFMGADYTTEYKVMRSIERLVEKTLHIRTAEQTDYYFDYYKITINKDKTEIKLR